VVTDGGKLRQILQNLIDNAIKFTDKGKVTVSARYFPEAGSVEFKVADTGIGIPKEKLPTIFEKFRQVDSSETRLYGGVGLGLFIVRQYTELIGGRVEVESEVGKGSTVTVTIPDAG
jgi:signal transduction histidine kinase